MVCLLSSVVAFFAFLGLGSLSEHYEQKGQSKKREKALIATSGASFLYGILSTIVIFTL